MGLNHDQLCEQVRKGEISEQEYHLRSLEIFVSEPLNPVFAGLCIPIRERIFWQLLLIFELLLLGSFFLAIVTELKIGMLFFFLIICSLGPLSMSMFFSPAAGKSLREFNRWRLKCAHSGTGVLVFGRFEGERLGREYRPLPYLFLLFSIQILPLAYFFPDVMEGLEYLASAPLLTVPIWLVAWVKHRLYLAAPIVGLHVTPANPKSGDWVEGFATVGPMRKKPNQIQLRLEHTGPGEPRIAEVTEISNEYESVYARFSVEYPVASPGEAEQWRWVVEFPLGGKTKCYQRNAVPMPEPDLGMPE